MCTLLAISFTTKRGSRAMSVAGKLRSQMRVPIIGAPLFIVSNPKLVVAQCRAGVVGSFPALNARGSESALDDWLVEIKATRRGRRPSRATRSCTSRTTG